MGKSILSSAGAMSGLQALLSNLNTNSEETPETTEVPVAIEGGNEPASVDAVAPTEKPKRKKGEKKPAAAKVSKPKKVKATKVEKTNDAGTTTAVEATPEEPKKPVEKRVFFGRNKIGRLEHKLGANIGKVLILTTEDAELEGDALDAKVTENKAAFKALAVKVQNRATNVLEFIGGKSSSLGKVTESVIRLLAKERKLTTGDKGNIYGKLSATYSAAAARAMGNSTLGMLRALNVVVETGKGTFEPAENSTILALLSERLGLSFVNNSEAIAEIEAKEAQERAAAEAVALDSTEQVAVVDTPAETVVPQSEEIPAVDPLPTATALDQQLAMI
jgi:hypothetical protein